MQAIFPVTSELKAVSPHRPDEEYVQRPAGGSVYKAMRVLVQGSRYEATRGSDQAPVFAGIPGWPSGESASAGDHGEVEAAFAGGLDGQFVAGVGMTHDAGSGVGR